MSVSASMAKEELVKSASTFKQQKEVNKVIEKTFCFTVNPFATLTSNVVFLVDLADEMQSEDPGRIFLDTDLLGRAVFERIRMTSDQLANQPEEEANKAVFYLASTYERVQKENEELNQNPGFSQDMFTEMKKILLQNLATALAEQELFDGQNIHAQFHEVLGRDFCIEFSVVTDTVNNLVEMERSSTAEYLMREVLENIKTNISSAPALSLGDRTYIQRLKAITLSPAAAEIFILEQFPKGKAQAREFSLSLLGTILTKSCLPDLPYGNYEYFNDIFRQTQSDLELVERAIWNVIDVVRDEIFELFNNLIRCSPTVKHLTMLWIGECLEKNSGRGKLWTSELGPFMSANYASDGFFLNLCDVLVRLCKPLSIGTNSSKILGIDPLYIAETCTSSESMKRKNCHLKDGSQETCLQPRDSKENRFSGSESYNFATDIFFLAHKAQNLGFRVCHENLLKLNQELARVQRLHRQDLAAGRSADEVQTQLTAISQRYMSMKAAMLVPSYLESLMCFSATSSSWLIQMTLRNDDEELTALKPLEFPLPLHKVSNYLKYIPEFVMDNIIEHIIFSKRFNPSHLEEQVDYLPSIFDFILTFMGSRTWVHNPHLRARMAECLEALLPKSDEGGLRASTFCRQALFNNHPHRSEIVSTLLHVFVDIELTGQSVAFEMKFNYRRPMYEIMKYLWEMEFYKERFLELASHAENHIDDEDAPLFLRFINLLINDAIFLLDEGLSHMKQIQQQQEERSTWVQLPPTERVQNERGYQHIGRLANFFNILGLETIQILDDLTADIRAVFTHPAMVDRIAGMLNYFLKNLVGPERKSFKVKNLEEFNFKPSEVVGRICKIYINYTDCKSFISAVSRDGRSYSSKLFEQAGEVLLRIGNIELADKLQEVAAKVKESAATVKADEELFADAPEHFLDALLSVLMTDPVKLPSSGQVVDRPTIARHLLSDQTDPFTRAPLTMDMVIPHQDLKDEIERWMANKRSGAKS